ncbi:TPA: hypothetical protein ACJV29_004077 [Salmonella enterica subsp. enterica serovar Ordonez]|uniref:DUF4062 domain-containing protein n=1 Tax=Salmonella ordonez TaxID=612 RepID=A0A5W5KFP2_SALOR|nr:hypothetical protein [Salmonella enterica]EBU8748160.1 hypothetical protein [Salmonella enterica subsp. enterica serovar Ordonez]EGL6538486.1 DUF4062 domain-containing protein [Salmonella enterica subsp. enterica]EBX2003626.1 hypothetical protein [Salmonella enterica subsp. enterica serovar Ordonez]EBY8091096.1 hypothetical protein [Salmonella enterica subsp. enterica serovar Ordonez]
MSFSATVLNVLIASPSDVPEEREAITESLYEWNALNSQTTGFVLLPVRWESHSAPTMGDRPQGIINNQVVRNCDMLIGAFWTRLGSPTGVEESGTVEEFKWFLKQQKPVMLYYSKKQVDLDLIDTQQLEKLKEFKKSIRDKGIQEQYTNVDELKMKLSRQLTIVLREVSVNTVVDVKAVKAAKSHEDKKFDADSSTLATSSPKAKVKKTTSSNEIRLIDYTEKAFVVVGDTNDYAEQLKELSGKWITVRWGGKAWMFSKKRLSEVSELLDLAPEMLSEDEAL